MVIYGEILFLENAASGAILLWMTGRLCGCVFKKKRLIFGAVMCGVYAFSIFQETGAAVSFLQKLLFSAVLMAACFGKCKAGRFVLHMLVFYGLSFLMGGITMGLAGLLASPASFFKGGFYLEHMTFLHIFSGCGATVLTVRLLLSFVRESRHRFQTRASVTVLYRGKEIKAGGFLDSGNLLMDPLRGRPVCLVTESLWLRLAEAAGESSSLEGMRELSYRTASGEEDMLCVIPPDRIQIKREKGISSHRVTLAVVKKDGQERPWGAETDILLHGWLIDEAFEDCEKVGMEYEMAP